MLKVHPQYITDKEGNKISVILPIKEFELLIEELEDMEDVQRFDAAQKEDDGERIPFSEYVKSREEQK